MTHCELFTVLARWFDCRRPGQGCSQGRSCQSDGTCDCLDGVSSADCRYSSPGYYDGGTPCTDDLQCAAGSKTCFNSSLTHVAEACACQDGFHGDKCQLPRGMSRCVCVCVKINKAAPTFIPCHHVMALGVHFNKNDCSTFFFQLAYNVGVTGWHCL